MCWCLTQNHRLTTVHWEDERWFFHESGEPLPEENVDAYRARRKRDRLNEALLARLLGRLGAFPWSAEFYALPERPCFALRRAHMPPTISRRAVSAVVRPG